MSLFTTFYLLFTILSLTTSKPKDEYVKGRRFTAVQCQSDNSTIIFHFCFVKAISRKVVTLNVGLTFVKTLKKFFVQFIENYRYGNIYREVINTHKMDYCSIMENADSNPFFSSVMKEVKESAGYMFHKCPYGGE